MKNKQIKGSSLPCNGSQEGYTWRYNDDLNSLMIMSGYSESNALPIDADCMSQGNLGLAGLALQRAGNSLRAAKHLGHAHHLGMLRSKQQRLEQGQTLELLMDDRQYSLICDSRFGSQTDSDVWEFLFWASLILDDEAGLDYLSMLYHRDGIFLERPGDGPWLDLLMTLFGGTDLPVAETIQAYVDASAQQNLSQEGFAYAVGIRLPALDLMLKIFGGESEADYQRSLHKALTHHHDYWSHRTPGDEFLGFPGDSVGDIAWPLTALARVAGHRCGYQPDLECDYLPPVFYREQPLPLELTGFAPLAPKPGDKPNPYA